MRRKGYRNLLVWKQSIDLVEASYSCTSLFPRNEDFVEYLLFRLVASLE